MSEIKQLVGGNILLMNKNNALSFFNFIYFLIM